METPVLFGETCALLTALSWSMAMILFKQSGRNISPLALNLFKNILGIGLLLLTVLVWPAGYHDIVSLRWKELGILMLSGIIGIAVADTIFFRALNLVGVGIQSIVDCLYSPLVILFSWLLLSERLHPWQYFGAALILSAVGIATRHKPPENRTSSELLKGILLGALAMALMAFGIVLAKPILDKSPVIWAAIIRLAAGTTLMALWTAATPTGRKCWAVFKPSPDWKLAVPAAVLGAYISMILWIAGFKFATASVAGVLNQTSTVFAIILASIFLKEHFTPRKFLAVTLAMGGSLLVILS